MLRGSAIVTFASRARCVVSALGLKVATRARVTIEWDESRAALNIEGRVFVANWLFVGSEVELMGTIWSWEFES